MVTLRNYRTTDYSQVKTILELTDLYWELSDNEQVFARKVSERPDSIIVAEQDGHVVGTQFVVDDFLPLMFRLAVHPNYRNRGIGKLLMQQGESLLRSQGRNLVNILVASNDEELQQYYVRQEYEKGHTYVWMFKRL